MQSLVRNRSVCVCVSYKNILTQHPSVWTLFQVILSLRAVRIITGQSLPSAQAAAERLLGASFSPRSWRCSSLKKYLPKRARGGFVFGLFRTCRKWNTGTSWRRNWFKYTRMQQVKTNSFNSEAAWTRMGSTPINNKVGRFTIILKRQEGADVSRCQCQQTD